MTNLLVLLFVILIALLYWVLISRANWKKRAICNEGVFLVLYYYPLIGNKDSLQSVRIKTFPGELDEAKIRAHKFLDNGGYKQINTASQIELFYLEKEMAKMFFFRWGIISETVSPLSD